MGMINSKDFINRRKIDEATSNSSLSNLRYVITEKPKWKVFKKKEVVALPQYRAVKGCPCGNDGPCKQKVTPKGVTIHYPQKKKKFGSFGPDRRYKPPKVQKSYFSRFKISWKSIPSAFPFQTRIQANVNINLPALHLPNMSKVNNAFKAIKSIKKPSLSSLHLKNIHNKALRSLKSFKTTKKKPAAPSMSKEFMFFPFMFSNPRAVNKVKVIRPKKFLTWRLDRLTCNSPFCRTAASRPVAVGAN